MLKYLLFYEMMISTENTCYFMMSLIGKIVNWQSHVKSEHFFGKHLVHENCKSSTTRIVWSPGVRQDIITQSKVSSDPKGFVPTEYASEVSHSEQSVRKRLIWLGCGVEDKLEKNAHGRTWRNKLVCDQCIILVFVMVNSSYHTALI